MLGHYRTLLLPALALAVLVEVDESRLAFAQVRAAGRDWELAPAVVRLAHAKTIFALGDVHGEYGRLIDLLVAGKLIAGRPEKPHQVKWAGGDALLICTGDLIDKGEHSLAVIELFRSLQTSAANAGGRVIVTMGNHEAEFLGNPQDDRKAAEFVADLKSHGIAPREVADGTDRLGIGVFLRSLPIAVRVGDWFFAHAGNTEGRTLDELDSALRRGIDQHGYGSKILSRPDSILEARLHEPTPWWEREGESPDQSIARLAGEVRALGAKHLVIGHQPGRVRFSNRTERKKGTIFQNFDGLVFLIDVGMSRAASLDVSKGALLRIDTGPWPTTTVIHHTGRTEQLWRAMTADQ